MEGLSLKQIMSFTPSFAAMVLEWIQDCVAIRLKGVYIVNNTYLFNMLFAIFKPFIREKLRNRVRKTFFLKVFSTHFQLFCFWNFQIFFLNRDWNSFHQHVAKEYLPEQYGGTLECPLIPGETLGELMAEFDNDSQCNSFKVLLSGLYMPVKKGRNFGFENLWTMEELSVVGLLGHGKCANWIIVGC